MLIKRATYWVIFDTEGIEPPVKCDTKADAVYTFKHNAFYACNANPDRFEIKPVYVVKRRSKPK